MASLNRYKMARAASRYRRGDMGVTEKVIFLLLLIGLIILFVLMITRSGKVLT